jgi:hypothetical protein
MYCGIYYNQKAQWIIKCEVTPSQPHAFDVVHEASLLSVIVVAIVFTIFVVL